VYLLLLTALAAPPLMPAADVAEPGLQAWWKQGELLLGHPEQEGRPGLKPLVNLNPVVLPEDLAGWVRLGESCVPRPESSREVEGERLTASVTASTEGPVVQVLSGERVVAQNALGRPAQVCEVLLAEADAIPGPEVIVAWRMELAGQADLRGITVFRVPETAR